MEPATTDTNPLALNMDIVSRMLIDFVRDESHNAGFTKAVLGLSGGVDSAVSAFLAARALGPENVLAVMMPYTTSSPESLADAQLVISVLGIRTETIDITPMVDPYLSKHDVTDKVRKGNVMARMRMIVLYDHSVRDNALVIGTSNKTETMLGYGTLFGDMACALNPLGDLYKTQVWDLARALSVPEKLIVKKPTADLWQGQTDEEELGFEYKDADRLLFSMIDERRTDAELLVRGFDASFINHVRTLVRRNQFKRRPPLIAKISYRTVNVDFRYVRDWGV
ncbi:MAG: NAD+ synthase [Ignavibacteriales bacterium]|nr:NAD+ synthase [Ignavibacteriales bacterium]